MILCDNVCIYIYTHVIMCIHICIYIYIYTHVHTHTNRSRKAAPWTQRPPGAPLEPEGRRVSQAGRQATLSLALLSSLSFPLLLLPIGRHRVSLLARQPRAPNHSLLLAPLLGLALAVGLLGRARLLGGTKWVPRKGG